MGEGVERKVPKNNVSAMKQKLAEMENKLTWVSWEMYMFCMLCLINFSYV